MNKLVITFVTFLYLASLVQSNDIRLGNGERQSKRIYSEIKEANPAIWKRTDDIVIDTSGNDVITAVFVTDLRDDKDGEAFIESGGIGEKSVTIGLKSPSILRGYKFEIEVYANDPSARYFSKGGVNSQYYDDTQYARKF